MANDKGTKANGSTTEKGGKEVEIEGAKVVRPFSAAGTAGKLRKFADKVSRHGKKQPEGTEKTALRAAHKALCESVKALESLGGVDSF